MYLDEQKYDKIRNILKNNNNNTNGNSRFYASEQKHNSIVATLHHLFLTYLEFTS